MVFAYSSVIGGDPTGYHQDSLSGNLKTRTLSSLAGFLLSRAESLALLYIGGIGFV